MDEVSYEKWTRGLREHPDRLRALVLFNKAAKWTCYVLYPLLLLLVGLQDPWNLVPYILVPGIGFAAVSAFRYLYNAPRPYESLDIDPLVKKSTVGKSFPSRHIFSIFLIAMCWLSFCLPVGIVLLAAGVEMAWSRVMFGVHFPKDVVCGALIGTAVGCILFFFI
ncbi:MAG: phosphatase PAP2 family protein [Coriobacteriales bacterium]|jgi:phosphatidylglycerophosphatase B